jgi:DNA-binding Lrp family transcriptional regulator
VPSAYVLIICELGYEDQTVNILNTLVGIDATRLAGAYDIIAKVNAESTESLSRIIGLDIKKLDRIKSTLTLIVNERILNQNSQKILLQLILHRKLLN